FVLVRKSIPGWWIWAYYMSPFAYALRAVVINEMRSPNWQQPNNATVVGGPTVGEAALQSFEFQTETVWIWTPLLQCRYLWKPWAFATVMIVIFLKTPSSHGNQIIMQALLTLQAAFQKKNMFSVLKAGQEFDETLDSQ
ncbi:hypothetical protein WJX84_010123, partial [Apatococcus fuscideae]